MDPIIIDGTYLGPQQQAVLRRANSRELATRIERLRQRIPSLLRWGHDTDWVANAIDRCETELLDLGELVA